jgi:repressor LexA
MKELTAIQQEILDFIKQTLLEEHTPPTMHEIAVYMGYRSDNAAYQHLQALERKEFLSLSGLSRGIELLIPLGLPIVGRVAAGAPILAEENIEDHVPIQPDLFKPKADYLLRVKGESMRDVGIQDGDLLAVRKTKTARNKQIVVARIDDEVTVKRFERTGNTIKLHPENPEFEVIRVNLKTQDFVVEGVMCGLIRGSRA